MKEAPLDRIELDPEAPPRYSVIWLHGLGADGNDFVPIVPELGLRELGVRFVFPHAPIRPVTLNAGMRMRAWYDIRSLASGRDVDRDHIEISSQQVERLIESELERGIESAHVLLAGFSQGGVVALHTGLRYPRRLAGIVALSTYYPEPDRIEERASAINRGLSIFYAHGTEDPLIPLGLADSSRRALEQAGYAVEWHTYPMEHQVSLEEIRELASWMKARLSAPMS